MDFSPAELTQLRGDTPGTAHCAHLNNAGAGLVPTPVLDAVVDHLQLEARIGAYEAAAREAERCAAVYPSIARLVGANLEEIALVENATVAWQMAFHGLVFNPGDRILTARVEYGANYVSYLQKARQTGVKIEIIPDGPDGASDPAALAAMIDERVKLIAITHIPTNGGLVNPAAEIGAIANEHNIPYLLDACQSIGQMPIDVEQLGCDFMSVTGRKFLRGPRGTGFLYVRKKWLEHMEPPFIDHFSARWTSANTYTLRPDARRFENWENAYALRLGLGAAAEYALDIGLERIQARSFALAEEVRAGLAGIPGVTVRDLGTRRCAIVSFSHDKVVAREIKRSASAAKINISVSAPHSTRLDADARNLPDLTRVSPHYYNSEEETARFVDVVKAL
jgi:cysteine desulfurase/selenocysteine lyase